MNSHALIRLNLQDSSKRCLANIEDMREHCMVPPTSDGGGHTLWVLGHLAYIESMVIGRFLLGRENALEGYEELFDGDSVSADPADYPSFDEVLAMCRDARARTLAVLDGLTEEDLDRESAQCPPDHEEYFGTYRRCLQLQSDHWYMHRGQLASARRAAGVGRMWV